MDTVRLKINGIDVEAPKNATILEAAHSVGIEIPTLCCLCVSRGRWHGSVHQHPQGHLRA